MSDDRPHPHAPPLGPHAIGRQRLADAKRQRQQAALPVDPDEAVSPAQLRRAYRKYRAWYHQRHRGERFPQWKKVTDRDRQQFAGWLALDLLA